MRFRRVNIVFPAVPDPGRRSGTTHYRRICNTDHGITIAARER